MAYCSVITRTAAKLGIPVFRFEICNGIEDYTRVIIFVARRVLVMSLLYSAYRKRRSPSYE